MSRYRDHIYVIQGEGKNGPYHALLRVEGLERIELFVDLRGLGFRRCPKHSFMWVPCLIWDLGVLLRGQGSEMRV